MPADQDASEKEKSRERVNALGPPPTSYPPTTSRMEQGERTRAPVGLQGEISVWFGWHFHASRWHRLCEAEDMLACSRLLDAALRAMGIDPWAKNLHRCLTQGSYPRGAPPAPNGDGVRRDR